MPPISSPTLLQRRSHSITSVGANEKTRRLGTANSIHACAWVRHDKWAEAFSSSQQPRHANSNFLQFYAGTANLCPAYIDRRGPPFYRPSTGSLPYLFFPKNIFATKPRGLGTLRHVSLPTKSACRSLLCGILRTLFSDPSRFPLHVTAHHDLTLLA